MTLEFYFSNAPTECIYETRTTMVPRVSDSVTIHGEKGVFQVVEVRWCYSTTLKPAQIVKILLGPTYPTALDRTPENS